MHPTLIDKWKYEFNIVRRDLRKNNSLVHSHTLNLIMDRAHILFCLSAMDTCGIILEAISIAPPIGSHFVLNFVVYSPL